MKFLNTIIFFILFLNISNAQNVNETIRKGNKLYQQGQFEQAETMYRKAIEQDPGNDTALYNLANALQKQKKFDEAIAVSEKLAVTSHDTSIRSAVFYNQGVAFNKLKNLESAIESYKKALRLNPNDMQARENLQKALLELKKQKQQQQKEQQKPKPKMSEKEARQKLELLRQKEKDLQERMQNRNKKQGGGQAQDW